MSPTPTRHLRFSSRLASSAPDVWNVVGTMEGVNAELGPWLRMSTPAELGDRRIEDAPLGEVLFSSWVLLAGIPIDRHHLRLEEIDRGRRFLERSSSWTERKWVHERTIEPLDASRCEVTDRLELTPRLAFATPILARVVALVFRHRHAQLRKRFGGAG